MRPDARVLLLKTLRKAGLAGRGTAVSRSKSLSTLLLYGGFYKVGGWGFAYAL